MFVRLYRFNRYAESRESCKQSVTWELFGYRWVSCAKVIVEVPKEQVVVALASACIASERVPVLFRYISEHRHLRFERSHHRCHNAPLAILLTAR